MGGNASEFQNEARFFFERKRRVSICGFQNDSFGKISLGKSIPPLVQLRIASLHAVQKPHNCGAFLILFVSSSVFIEVKLR